METKKPLLVIVGPTASGKTSLSIELARKLRGEVISADSRQVYRGLDIGSGKVTKREKRGVQHHCLDIYSPRATCTVSSWRKHALEALDHIYRTRPALSTEIHGLRNRVFGHEVVSESAMPILAGGTGYYVDTLVYEQDLPEVPPNPTLRRALMHQSPAQLLVLLATLDPARADTIEQKNPRRLIRAIEVATALGRVPPQEKRTPRYDTVWLGLCPPKEVLHQKIHDRLVARLRHGMVAEVAHLHAGAHQAPLSWERLENFGLEYRYVARYVQGKLSKDEMFDQLYQEIKKYARRQMTWFKRNKEILWFPSAPEALASLEKGV